MILGIRGCRRHELRADKRPLLGREMSVRLRNVDHRESHLRMTCGLSLNGRIANARATRDPLSASAITYFMTPICLLNADGEQERRQEVGDRNSGRQRNLRRGPL
jgi:hypothetical protein